MLAKICSRNAHDDSLQFMNPLIRRRARRWPATAVAIAAVVACSSARSPSTPAEPLGAARPGVLAVACSDLASRLAWPDARLSATQIGEGELVVAGARVAAHCRVTGSLRERTGSVDGQRYAIGFGLRLPERWNGRTDDGVVISVRNRVLSRQPREPANAPRYAVSTLDIVAPEGKYGWLNDWVYVGTLHGLRPRPDVLIRVYKVV